MSTRQRGVTYLELIATAGILMILASAILPVARVMRTRQKEIELRRSLREVRRAIDDFYYRVTVTGEVGGTDVNSNTANYPKDLDTLVEGVSRIGTVPGSATAKLKFLRRIPIDPMTGKNEWGMRCYQDDPDEESWCGDNVYDIYSLSEAKALDGSYYHDW
jgi:general secretion pathway protein G